MLFSQKTNLIVTLLLTLVISACSSAAETSGIKSNKITATTEFDVYKSPTCKCCDKWIDHLEEQGMLVKSYNTNELEKIKDDNNVPKNYRSCHTAISKDGYVFEGHIPANIINKFLKEKPKNSIGLVVPGMPVGSPGMAYQNKFTPYTVMSIQKDGSVTDHAKVNTEKEQFE